MQANRIGYKRRWIAARRTLSKSACSSTPIPNLVEFQIEPNDADQSIAGLELEQSDTEHFELLEPSPKRLNVSESCANDQLHSSQENYYSSSSDSDDLDEKLRVDLAEWVNAYQIKHNAADRLLKILKESGHPSLPGSTRTLTKTARYVPSTQKSGMDYVYFPVKEELMQQFLRYPKAVTEKATTLELSLNIDGLPLFKSSNNTLWPILCGIMNVEPVTVFPVALTYGRSKPSNLEFLQDTIDDLNVLLNDGLDIGERVIPISIRCIVCDAPAKALVKGTKLYSGYFGCDKCCQRGEWFGRMIYPDTRNLELRTDTSFRNQSNDDHHRTDSPFCQMPIDMVDKFPVDYMHQLCLGVMKKLLLIWMRGNRDVKISARQVEEISQKLIGLKSAIPSSFARKPRSLSDIDRWKATEFRQFLLYTGKIVLDGILRTDLYAHFTSLSIASRILVSPTLVQTHWKYASDLLVYFVEKGRDLYGKEFLVYNVHSMLHLARQAKEFGGLDSCSSFPFENYMQTLKRMVRSGKNPIAQLTKRLSELRTSKIPEKVFETALSKKPDNAFILENGFCCEVLQKASHCDENGNTLYQCRVYEHLCPLFNTPCDSRIVGIYRANSRSSRVKLLPSVSFAQKAIMFEIGGEDTTIFMAILHTVL